MDFLRFCYYADCQYFTDPLSGHYIQRWYWAPDGAEIFPGHHVFGALWMWKGQENPGVGPQPQNVWGWVDGATPPGVVGAAPDGELSYFEDGQPGDVDPLPRWDNGIPEDCGDNPDLCAPWWGDEPGIVFAFAYMGGTFLGSPLGSVGSGLIYWPCPEDGSYQIRLRSYPDIPADPCSSRNGQKAYLWHDDTYLAELVLLTVFGGTQSSTWQVPATGPISAQVFEIDWEVF